MILLRFALSVGYGFAAHSAHYVTRRMPPGWANLADHAFGATTLFALFFWWFSILHRHGATESELRNEILSAGAVSSLGYGIGNACAWVVESFGRQDD